MLLLPKVRLSLIPSPLIFLVGPIACAPPWHAEAIHILHELAPDVHVACPNLHPHGIADKVEVVRRGDGPDFESRRAWEWYYLEHAAKHGVIMAWLPTPQKHDCNIVYGATTRLELGQWMTRALMDPSINLCVGSDGGFPVISVIARDLLQHLPNSILQPTLRDTCEQAVRMLNMQRFSIGT